LDNEAKQKRNPQEFKPARQRDENSSTLIYQGSHSCDVCPKEEQISVLLSSLHHDSAICSDSGKPEIIEFYNKTKDAVNTLDQMCARYSTVQRTTRRWTMAMFYGMINTAAVNALVIYIYAHNMRKDQPEKKIKRKDFS
jgi:hypothetical protein